MAGSRRDLRKGVLPSVFEWNESKKGAISNTQAFDTVVGLILIFAHSIKLYDFIAVNT